MPGLEETLRDTQDLVRALPWASVKDKVKWTTVAQAVIVLALLVLPFTGVSNYVLDVMTQAGLYAIIAITVGLVLGQAGQLSFGHSAFYGIGAYVGGLLNWKYGVPPFACFLIGGAAAGVVAVLVGRPVLRLKYFYLALATMGLGQIFLAVVFEVKSWGAANGFGPVDPLQLFGFKFTGFVSKYYMVWVFCLLVLLFVARFLKYRSGRALRALSVSEIAASTLGVRTANWKLAAFAFGAVICGFAGGLFAFKYTAVDPHTFSFAASVLPIVMMLIGGDRWIWGSVIGAIILTWVMNGFSQSMLQYNGAIWSVVMILLLLFLPAGILGLRPRFAQRLWVKIRSESLKERPVGPGESLTTGAAGAAFSASSGVPPTEESEGITSAAVSAKVPGASGVWPYAEATASTPALAGGPPAPTRREWGRQYLWWMPLLLIFAAFVVMNVMSFLEPAGSGAGLRETRRALAGVLKEGRFLYGIGLPIGVAMGLVVVRRRFWTLAAALVTLGVSVELTVLSFSPTTLVGVKGSVSVGTGVLVGTALSWLAFVVGVASFVEQTRQERHLGAVVAPLEECSSPAVRNQKTAPLAEAGTADSCLLLRIEDASVHFGGLKAVSGVSFAVKEGSITALIGPNGAGKTTLFNAVSRLQPLTGGRIFFAGEEVTKLDAASVARLGMARTFQNLRLFVNMSVLDNVLVGRHRHERSGFVSDGLGFPWQKAQEARSRAKAMQALALVGLAEQAHLPAASLPYGQQRLVEIARALASEPRLLLLDEPAAGMNQVEREDLVKRIAAIRDSGVTVLLVEHDIDLVMDISDTVNVLDYGQLIASGTPEVVQKDEKVIAAYLGVKRDQQDICLTSDLLAKECEDLLVVEDLVTSYGSVEALHGVSLRVPRGMVVAVLGTNGAGKSTLLHTISGIVRPDRGRVVFAGTDVTRLAPEKIVAKGICQVPEGRQLFPTLTVEDNLLVGATGRADRRALADDMAYVYELFPVLGERRKQAAGTLSGGEQQMLAIGRALMGKPSLLLLDEPSMGLAPMMVERIFEALARLNQEGLTMLMVEQNAEMALSLAHLGVVLVTGTVTLSGTASALRMDDRVRASYLGGC